ncbi:MAG TPA: DUF2231 domain-containing protein [Actinopolymorphaceae bacterium]|jgi:hypothetical protein
MFDEIAGLPMHALVIHAVVAFVPLVVLIALGYAIVPRWRWLLRWPLLVGSAFCLVTGFVAKLSGEALFERLGEPEFVAEHADRGTLLVWVLLAFFVVSLLAALFLSGPNPIRSHQRSNGPALLRLAVTVLLIAAALSAGVQVVLTGDAGARAVWG